ncbi:FAD dependent oxidoreductase [Haloferula helveola]|uniref:FAD dependent oxidoreductase n=1 Tax=Haloferula helveola TaxID=490095 RepID=A0ABN6H041_9BACT|nr:FAD dependent oxidoreductase [Haloferula helveola]
MTRSLCLALVTTTLPLVAETHDLLVYGGTSAGISAAVQAKRMGKTVVVVCPDKHLGGLSSGGLGWTDSGKKHVIGGISREFYARVRDHYDEDSAWNWQTRADYGSRGFLDSDTTFPEDTMWLFEPHVAEGIFEDLVKEYEIPVHRDEWLDRKKGVRKQDGRIVSISTLSGKTWEARMFIDATYEGDLLDSAGVGFTVGREGNAKYGETLNGVQTRRARSHQFDKPVDPYVKPGDPSSGLLPRIHGNPPGEEGGPDHRMQAYCFRTCMTNHPENRMPWPKPDGYDPLQYELGLRYLQAGWIGVFNKFDPLPNRKTDTNNHGGFSFDNIGYNYDYPEGSYERRAEIIAEHETYQKGWLWFLANDPRVPKDIQQRINQWGLAKDEFIDNGHWPHQLYIREARRMISDFVITENHLRRLKPTPRPVGMGSYNMDSHHVQRYVDEHGHARNEGDIQINPGGPYPIDYGAIVPKKEECENLLVPVCVSSSHIAYGSIRMEPVFMILGQSAATAACLSLDRKLAVQDLPYEVLHERLVADKQVLEDQRPGDFVGLKSLKGIVIDDEKAVREGNWTRSNIAAGVHRGYQHDGAKGDGSAMATFTAELEPGEYEIRIGYTALENRATNVPVTVVTGREREQFTLNQRRKPAQGTFQPIGRLMLGGETKVILSNRDTDGHVIIDAVQFLPVE